MPSYNRIYRAMCGIPWAVQLQKLEAFVELLHFRMEGGRLDPEEILERVAHPKRGEDRAAQLLAVEASSTVGVQAAAGTASRVKGSVAVLPIYGVITHRPSMDLSGGGGFSIENFRTQFRALLDNPDVGAIVLDVDSPGGSTDAVDELSKEIFQARGQKRIIAVANTLMASAAYYIGSAADEVAVTPSGQVGSIGVYMLHQDLSGLFENDGVKNTLIKAGKYKAEGNPYEPLGDDALENIQSTVNGYYDLFVKAVARNRGVSVEAVRQNYGEGRVLMAKDAVKVGMADRVATLDDVLAGLGVGKSPRQSAKAEDFPTTRAVYGGDSNAWGEPNALTSDSSPENEATFGVILGADFGEKETSVIRWGNEIEILELDN